VHGIPLLPGARRRNLFWLGGAGEGTIDKPVIAATLSFSDESMNVSKYKLVAAPQNEIEQKVNELIEAGWQPLGAPFLLPEKDDNLTAQENIIYQAMVRPAPGLAG
jgi:hypothetical protein